MIKYIFFIFAFTASCNSNSLTNDGVSRNSERSRYVILSENILIRNFKVSDEEINEVFDRLNAWIIEYDKELDLGWRPVFKVRNGLSASRKVTFTFTGTLEDLVKVIAILGGYEYSISRDEILFYNDIDIL